ncbi:MAG: FAD/NAD(P)-binding oxidoreductase, partial [Dehalococcoidia bacterium]
LLILGAGAVGSIVANKVAGALRRQIARGQAEVTVLDRNETSINQGGYTFIPFGLYTPEDITRKRRELLSPRVRAVFGPDGEVLGVDLKSRKVSVKSGRQYPYDYLLIALGCECDCGSVPGLDRNFDTFYTGLDDALKLKEKLDKLEKGHVVVLTAGMPIPCPGAPGKFTTLLDDYLKSINRRDPSRKYDISFLWPIPEVGTPEYNKVFSWGFRERGIDDRRSFKLDRVESSTRQVVSRSGESVSYDLLVTVPLHRSIKALVDSGLTDESGWLPVDRRTLRYKKGTENHPEVYVGGDAGPATIPKTGIGAHYQALIIAQNLVNDLRGTPVAVPYRGETGCPFVLRSYTSSQSGMAYIASWTDDNPLPAFKPTELGWFFYRMYYYIYWDTAIKGLM